jgi:hypothetical protein
MFSFQPSCRSGDNTLEALQSAIEEVDAMPGDGKFVFLLSDANLRRYGISGKTVSAVSLTQIAIIQAPPVFSSSYLKAQRCSICRIHREYVL